MDPGISIIVCPHTICEEHWCRPCLFYGVKGLPLCVRCLQLIALALPKPASKPTTSEAFLKEIADQNEQARNDKAARKAARKEIVHRG